MKKNKRGHKKKSVLRRLKRKFQLFVVLVFIVYLFIMNKYQTGTTMIAETNFNEEVSEIISEEVVKNFVLTTDTDLTVTSNVSAEDIDKMLSGTALEGLGSSFVEAEEKWRS